MHNKIYPCLWFDGNGKEAADFYCDVFPNASLQTDTGLVQIFEIAGKKIHGTEWWALF